MKTVILLLVAGTGWGQSGNGKLGDLLTERGLYEATARMKTDERIAMFEALGKAKPDDLHYQCQMAATYLQKMRETMDPEYLNRAAKIVENVLAADRKNYEALRLRSAIGLERHDFPKVAAESRELIEAAPDDPWNWGTLGDALMELGEYSAAADAYQTMVRLRPDMASYNRAAYYRFVAGDAAGAREIMKRAIESGSRSPENIAWCLVDLGNMDLKTGNEDEALRSFEAALKLFPGYHPAYGGLGKWYAQRGETARAIENYLKAQQAVPLPEYAAALEDLYRASGKAEEARRQAARLEVIERVDRAAGFPANRNLAMAYADHGRNLDRALAMIREEMKTRHDVYEYDALAWVLYQKQQYAEAKEASDKALELGTPEPGFRRHAAMIAQALEEAKK
ncbi:MAG TPA: tetratricopeptide repeat protein [Verrucomicrobiae bacterium]|nr:tetratricopeptide repeat protein [Verrucomicrobiae bacterium]